MSDDRDKFRDMCFTKDDEISVKQEKIFVQASQINELKDYEERIRKRIKRLERDQQNNIENEQLPREPIEESKEPHPCQYEKVYEESKDPTPIVEVETCEEKKDSDQS